jgi:hypothetical protein
LTTPASDAIIEAPQYQRPSGRFSFFTQLTPMTYQKQIAEHLRHSSLAHDMDFVRSFLILLGTQIATQQDCDDKMPPFTTPAARNLFANIAAYLDGPVFNDEIARASRLTCACMHCMLAAIADFTIELADDNAAEGFREHQAGIKGLLDRMERGK